MLYLGFKLVHIAAVILFLGNIITGLFWKMHADRTRSPQVIAHTFEGIIRSDRWFTLPSIIVILIGGFASAIVGRIPILGTGWILWSIALFTLSGLAFSFRVAPLQAKLATLARTSGGTNSLIGPATIPCRGRGRGGVFALLAPVAAVVLMVFKPTLPAF